MRLAPPKTVTEGHSFLGLVRYCRWFIPKFAQIAAPLTQLLSGHATQKKNSLSPSIKAQWHGPQQHCFKTLRQKFTLAPLLAYIDYTKPLWVYTNRNLQGMGAVLAQVKDGCEWVIAYVSCSLWPTEMNPHNYSSFKLELLAREWAFTKKFVEYLTGAEIEVFTDNNPLAYLDTAKLGVLE